MAEYQRQHLVSQVLLRRFADPTTGRLQVFDKELREEWEAVPRRVAFVKDFIISEPAETEARWQRVEQELPGAFHAVDDESILSDDRFLDVLRDCFALHWARSHMLRIMWEHLLPATLDRSEAEMVLDPQLPSVFWHLTGLYPTGLGALEYAAARMRRVMEDQFATGEFFRERVEANFDDARRRLAELEVEIAYATEGEFLIGDVPAVTLAAGNPGVGPLGGVPWGEADAAMLPIGPRHVVGFASQSSWRELDVQGVARLNSAQLGGSIRQVFYRPRSGLGAFAASALPERPE